MSPFYWERHPYGAFGTRIAVAATYLEPENYDLDSFKALAKLQDDEEMRVFKSELRQALKDPSQLPGDELSEAVEYDNGSDEAFLRWLWHELHGDEPVDSTPSCPRPSRPRPRPAPPPPHLVQAKGDSHRLAEALAGKGVIPLAT